MDEVKFFRWAAAGPVFVLVASLPLGLADPAGRTWAGQAAGFTLLAAMLVGPAYAVFAPVTLWALRRQGIQVHRWVSILAPFLFLPVLAIFLGGRVYLARRTLPSTLELALSLSWALGVGAVYIVAVHVVRYALATARVLHTEEKMV